MDNPNAVFWWLGLEIVVGLLWTFALIRAYSHLMTNAFFGAKRPLVAVEFWRYLFATVLMFVTVAILLIILSHYDPHHPLYKYPIAIIRLITVNFVAGFVVASVSWFVFKIKMTRMARFHHPNLATWKGMGFWGPEKRRMTSEERTAFLRKLDFSDYIQSLGLTALCFAALPWFLFWFALMSQPPTQSIRSVILHQLEPLVPCEILLAGVGIIFGTVVWVLRRLLVWVGWIRTLV